MHLHNVNCNVFSVENGTTFSQINWAFRSETDLSHPSKELEGQIGSPELTKASELSWADTADWGNFFLIEATSSGIEKTESWWPQFIENTTFPLLS